jgi:hypothetical protein
MFRHDYIADYHKAVALPHFFQNFQEQVAAAGAGQPGLAVVATASEEVQMPVAVIALEALRHLHTVGHR